MHTFKAAAASISSRWGTIDANLQKISAAADRAADQGARLLLLPECCLTGADWPTSECTPELNAVALALDCEPMHEVGRIARRTGLVIAVGLYEKQGQEVYISQALVGPRGLAGVYRKVHEGSLSSRDKELFPVFDLKFARVGISICYDNMFPECARILALKGAEVLLSPFTSLPLSRRAWRLGRLVALRARAQDNRLFVLSASHARPHVADRPAEWGYSGICCAIDPLGEVLAESQGRVGRPQHLAVTFDAACRRTYLLADVPSLLNRRPCAYDELADAGLQEAYLEHCPPFAYNDTTARLTIPAKRS